MRVFLACSPFLLCAVIALSYPVCGWIGRWQVKRFLAELEVACHAVDLEKYYVSTSSPERDVFQHPAMMRELEERRVKGLWTRAERPPGLARSKPRVQPHFAIGADVGDWLVPAESDEIAAAGRLLGEMREEIGRMEALRDALARPEAAWGIRWTTSDSTIGNAVPEVATQMFFLRSLVRFESELVPLHLAHGDSDSAAECVRSMTRICSHLLDSRSSVVTLLLADAVAVEIERGIWEGVIRGVWSESQLAEFEKRLGELDPQASAARSFRGEVAFARWKSEAVLQQVDEARLKRELHLTSGWEWNGNRISKRGRAIWRTVRPQGINLILWVKGERLMVEHLSKAEREAGARFGYDELRYFQRRDADSPRALFVDPAGGDDEQVDLDDVVWRRLESITAMVLRMETRMAIVRAGIALERHRLANGEAAKSLAALVPQYLSSVPADPIDGEPLRYRQQADGSPVLWSIGVDGVDEGGLPHIDRGARGDIVWITRPIPGFTIKEYWR